MGSENGWVIKGKIMAIQSGPNVFWAGQFCPRVMWLPKLLLPYLKIRIFGPKTAKFGPKYALLVVLGQVLAFGPVLDQKYNVNKGPRWFFG